MKMASCLTRLSFLPFRRQQLHRRRLRRNPVSRQPAQPLRHFGDPVADGGAASGPARRIHQRAFAHGKLDLVEVEGLSDLLRAETEMQRRLARSEAGGSVSRLCADWSDQLLRLRALVEAGGLLRTKAMCRMI